MRRRSFRIGLLVFLVLLALATAAGWLALYLSQPRIDGTEAVPQLAAAVRIERDALGVPVIRGGTRADVAIATGFAHAQDRFFQMDLLRRAAAGELAALLGPALLERDRRIRLHQFRARAEHVLAALPPAERALLDAYVAGVNSAVAAARLRPPEYLLLRARPEPWRAEDSLLVNFAMWLDLQDSEARVEQQQDRLATALPAPLYRLLTDPEPEWEAPLDGSRLPRVPLPDAAVVDLRRLDRALFENTTVGASGPLQAAIGDWPAESIVGSNNWALSGRHTASGRALVANDMHLPLRVPNVWYRARFVVEAEALDVSGVSLPGVPVIIAGSNRHVAWGFTNSYGDFQDLVVLEPAPDGQGYLTADGPRSFETDTEVIEVASGEPEPLDVRRTIWGPVIGADAAGRELALAWTAHHGEAVNLHLFGLERARNLDEAAVIAAAAGMPAQNVVLGDASGRIGWVLSGRLPRRQGFDPSRPAAWHEAGVGWQGWINPEQSPRLLDPADGRAWSANARVVGGPALALIGDGGYAPAARARQIRDAVSRLERATPADLLAIQLDDSADYLRHWQPVLVAALERRGEREAAALVAGWAGRAAVNDAGYRLLREFERAVTRRAFAMLTAEARARWPEFRWRAPLRFTEVAWRLLSERPAHLLDPRFADWDAWLADIAAEIVAALPADCGSLRDCRWGRVNRARVRHPLSQALPFLARWLDMPAAELPGDWSMPRVQSPAFGASERFAVAPGLEHEGYLHMPGGQSGHPLSPFYRAGHDAWVRGEPAPFLPGPAAHVLTLVPGTGR